LLLSRVKRFERSEAVELLERLEPALFDEHQGPQIPRGLKKGNKKNSHRIVCAS
jgi:hypothetical protein